MMEPKARKFLLLGGPYARWEGEFIDVDQPVVMWGPPGAHSFAYKRCRREHKKRVLFRYDTELTAMTLRLRGVDEATVQEALRGEVSSEPTTYGTQQIEESDVRKLQVRVDIDKRSWARMYVGDEIVAETDALGWDREALKAWVGSVCLPG